MLKVNPVTFEVLSSDYCAGQKIKERLTKKFSSLKDLNDWLLEQIENHCDDLPADTRFPGFFTSLSDHAVLTSAIAVAIALDLAKKGVDFSLDCQGEFSERFSKLLKNEKDLKEVVRCASLLHDIGKHPPREHYIRTEKYAREILDLAGFSDISYDLSKLAARHHYGQNYPEDYRPRTKIEWIVAIADKTSVLERIVFSRNRALVEVYSWLLELGEKERKLTDEDKENIHELIEYLKGERTEIDPLLVPVDLDKLQSIDRLVFNPKEVFGEEPRIGILCLEIAGIQKFITGSDFRKYVSGASALLENVLKDVENYLKNLLAKESVIYAKGGALLAIVPSSYYEEIKNNILRLFRKRTAVVLPKLPPKKVFAYRIDELKYGPRICQENENLVCKRNFGSVVSRTLNFLEVEEDLDLEMKIPIDSICKSCYEYEGEILTKIEEEEIKVCKRCNLVLEEHKKTKESLLLSVELEELKIENLDNLENETWRAIARRFKEKLSKNKAIPGLLSKGVKKLVFKSVETWNYLGRQHFSPLGENTMGVYDVAFVKGDGDNFGKIKENSTSPALYRQISHLFERVIEHSIVEGFSDILIKEIEILNEILELKRKRGEKIESIYELEIPFDTIYIGGDDFLVLMDAAYIFTFLKAYRGKVQEILGKRKSSYEKEAYKPLSIFPLGVSIGVAIVKNRAPIASTISTLNSMVKKAKEKSKSDSRPFGSEIYIYLQKFDQIPTENEVNSYKDYTSFPMNGEEFEEFVENLKFFVSKNVSPNWIRRVFGKEKPENYIEACINLLFKMARTDKNSSEFEVLKRLYELHGKFELAEAIKYKHIDISDAIRVLTENVEKELTTSTVRILLG